MNRAEKCIFFSSSYKTITFLTLWYNSVSFLRQHINTYCEKCFWEGKSHVSYYMVRDLQSVMFQYSGKSYLPITQFLLQVWSAIDFSIISRTLGTDIKPQDLWSFSPDHGNTTNLWVPNRNVHLVFCVSECQQNKAIVLLEIIECCSWTWRCLEQNFTLTTFQKSGMKKLQTYLNLYVFSIQTSSCTRMLPICVKFSCLL